MEEREGRRGKEGRRGEREQEGRDRLREERR